tara:strand:- start:48 stop:182 length:135 start_codon:yes stop_codon:yes gene_type:complete
MTLSAVNEPSQTARSRLGHMENNKGFIIRKGLNDVTFIEDKELV